MSRKYGDHWRTLAHTDTGPVEAQSHGDSDFDELVIGNSNQHGWLHIEQMSDNHWWFGFYLDNDLRRRVCGSLIIYHTKPNEFHVWTEYDDAPERSWSSLEDGEQ